MHVWFDHANGLMTKGESTPEGFEIAGADRNYRPATARVVGDGVLVSSPEVPEPRFVRYGWKDVPHVNLYNGANLPASPFSSEELLPASK